MRVWKGWVGGREGRGEGKRREGEVWGDVWCLEMGRKVE